MKRNTRMFILLSATLFLGICQACETVKTNKMKDQGFTITGLALNGKGGALIKTSEGEVFYIEGLSAWASDFSNKRVKVTGNLKTETVTEEELKDEEGAWKQGIAGKINVIQNAKWTILSNE